MSLFGTAHRWGEQNPLPKVDPYPNLHKEDQKIYQSSETPVEFADISIFLQVLAIFIISKNKDKNCILIHDLWFVWLLLTVIIKVFSKIGNSGLS